MDIQTVVRMIGATALLVPNAVNDFRKKEILLRYSLGLGVMGMICSGYFLMQSQFTEEKSLVMTVLWYFVIALLPGVLTMLVAYGSKGAIGCGDAVILLAMGMWLGGWQLLSSISVSLGLLFPVGMVSFIKRKRREIPYVPFLACGTGLVFIVDFAGKH